MSSEWEGVGGDVAGGSAWGSAEKFFKTGGNGGNLRQSSLFCLLDSSCVVCLIFRQRVVGLFRCLCFNCSLNFL